MPLDSTHYDTEIDLTELRPGDEGLRQLAYLLRHPEKWVRHRWTFSFHFKEEECGTAGCAYGVAKTFWPDAFSSQDLGMMQQFDISPDVSERLFARGMSTYSAYMLDVTPTMVADAIDYFLATGRVPAAEPVS